MISLVKAFKHQVMIMDNDNGPAKADVLLMLVASSTCFCFATIYALKSAMHSYVDNGCFVGYFVVYNAFVH